MWQSPGTIARGTHLSMKRKGVSSLEFERQAVGELLSGESGAN